MTRPADGPPQAFADLDDAIRGLRDSGLRLSTARRLVLDALFAAEAPVSAAQLARIKTAGAQVLFVGTTGPGFGTVLRGVNDIGMDIPVMTNAGKSGRRRGATSCTTAMESPSTANVDSAAAHRLISLIVTRSRESTKSVRSARLAPNPPP